MTMCAVSAVAAASVFILKVGPSLVLLLRALCTQNHEIPQIVDLSVEFVVEIGHFDDGAPRHLITDRLYSLLDGGGALCL